MGNFPWVNPLVRDRGKNCISFVFPFCQSCSSSTHRWRINGWCGLPCGHRSKLTWVVQEILTCGNRLRSTHCRNFSLDTIRTRLLRENYSIITSPSPLVVAGFAYYVINVNWQIRKNIDKQTNKWLHPKYVE